MENNNIYLTAERYCILKNILISELNRIENIEKKDLKDELAYDNVKFELQILLNALSEYTQYDEESAMVLIPFSPQNKNRLLGFLINYVIDNEESLLN